MKKGYVIEFNVRGLDGTVYPDSVITSKEYGREVFNDLTKGEQAGASFDKDLLGAYFTRDKITGKGKSIPVYYDRAFVVLP